MFYNRGAGGNDPPFWPQNFAPWNLYNILDIC